MAAELRTEAIVLRHISYGEADLIVSLFSRDKGIIKGFARSAKNSRKRFSSALQPFAQSIFRCRQGKGAMLGLLDADLLFERYGLRTDLKTLAFASYSIEMIELFLGEGEPNEQAFTLLTSCLDFLETGGDPRIARLLFELRLIALLGYLPHLLHCSSCQKIFKDEPVVFDCLRGGSLCPSCSVGGELKVGLGTLGSLSRVLQTPYSSFVGFYFGQRTLNEAGSLLSQVLLQHLSKEPKTMKFMRQIGI
jgi:DNA repair protein RecO (recombination protein O)